MTASITSLDSHEWFLVFENFLNSLQLRLLLALKVLQHVSYLLESAEVFRDEVPEVSLREECSGRGFVSGCLEGLEEIVHFLPWTFPEEYFYLVHPADGDILAVCEVQIVQQGLIGTSHAVQLCLDGLDGLRQQYSQPGNGHGRVVAFFDCEFSGMKQRFQFIIHFLEGALVQLDVLRKNFIDEEMQLLDKVPAQKGNFGKYGEGQAISSLTLTAHKKLQLCLSDSVQNIFAGLELVQEPKSDREELRGVDKYVIFLLEDTCETLHEAYFLLLRQGVVEHPDYGPHYPYDLLLDDVSRCKPHQKLQQLDALVHDGDTAVSEPFDCSRNIVLCDVPFFPYEVPYTRVVLQGDHQLAVVQCSFAFLDICEQYKIDLVHKCQDTGVGDEHQMCELPDEGLKVVLLRDQSGVHEEGQHAEEYEYDPGTPRMLPLNNVREQLADVVEHHLDELSLVLIIEFEGDLTETVDDKGQSVLLLLVVDQHVDLFYEHMRGWWVEVRVEMVGQSVCVVGYHLYLELRERRLHGLGDYPIDHFGGGSVQEVFHQVETIAVLRRLLTEGVHAVHFGVYQVLEEDFLVHLLHVQRQTLCEGAFHFLGHREHVLQEEIADEGFVLLFGQELLVHALDELAKHFEDAFLVQRVLEEGLQVLKDLVKVVLGVLTREGDDVLEHRPVGRVCPASPHLDEFRESCAYGLGRVVDVCVPYLLCSDPWHFQLVVLNDVHRHERAIVGVGLVVAAGVIHVVFDNVEQLAKQEQCCVTFAPIVLEHPVAKWVQQQVRVTQTIVVDQHLFDLHGRVAYVFVLIGDEGVHVAVDILDEFLELLRAYGGHIQKHQDIPFFLRMLYFVQLIEDFIDALLEVFVAATAYQLGVCLCCTLSLSGVRSWALDDIYHKVEAVLRLLDADLGSNAADRHGSDGPDFRQRVAQCHLKASVNDADVRQQVLWILDQLYDTAHNLTGTCLELRAASSHAVVQDRDNYGE